MEDTNRTAQTLIDSPLFGADAMECANRFRRRCPALLMVDTSRTVERCKPQIEASVRALYDALMKDDVSCSVMELGILLFNRYPDPVLPIGEIARQTPEDYSLDLNCRGRTHTGEAVLKALSMLDVREHQLREDAQHPYVPVLCIVTDGNPNFSDDPQAAAAGKEALDQAYAELEKRVRRNELQVIVAGVGDACDDAVLKRLAGGASGCKPIRIGDGSQISDLFRFVSRSLNNASRGKGVLNNQQYEQMRQAETEEAEDDSYEFDMFYEEDST
ncbi:MAG: VWA domain-containing protein [Oscillospiraceae bacterium]|nr:VWA domain-containing protein [Oscillospiraceae bacterium]